MSTTIVFIDSRVTDYQTLIASLATPAEVFILDAQSDGLAQMADPVDVKLVVAYEC